MKINFTTKEIEMNKTEAKAVNNVTGDAFNELQQLRAICPTFAIKVVATKRKKNEYKGLTYGYMRSYIKSHGGDDKEALLEKFDALTNDKEACYFDVRDWFLDKCPEVKDYKKDRKARINAIVNEAA